MKVIKGINKGSKTIKEKVTIDKDRYEDLLLSEEVLKELANYSFTNGKWEKVSENGNERKFKKVNQRLDVKQVWQRETRDFFLQIINKSLLKYGQISFMGHPLQIQAKAKKDSNELTPLEKRLYLFCQKKGIDLSKSKGNSIDKIHYEAEAMGFKNLEGKKKLARSTVGKMLTKIRP